MASLSDLCYEQINERYWHGLFGDFRLIVDRERGNFNGTRLCEDGGRKLESWLKTEQFRELDLYSEVVKGHSQIWDRVEGSECEGIYLCKESLVPLACWLSPAFADRVNAATCDRYVHKFKQMDEDKIKRRVQTNEERNDKLREGNQGLRRRDDGFVPPPKIAGQRYEDERRSVLVLVKKNKEGSQHPYYAMRTRRLSMNGHLEKLRQRYPDLEIVLTVNYDSNSVNLLARIRNRLSNLHVKYNCIKLLHGYTEEDLMADVRKLADMPF